jgi:hypothetical protein
MFNANTIPDLFPIPRIDDLLESIPKNCRRYSLSDADAIDAFFKCSLGASIQDCIQDLRSTLAVFSVADGICQLTGDTCRLIARTYEGKL